MNADSALASSAFSKLIWRSNYQIDIRLYVRFDADLDLINEMKNSGAVCLRPASEEYLR